MPAFTKGKWEITGEKKRHLGYITCNISSWVYDDEGGSQIEIATVDGTNNAETRANARLIAAAPEMYRILCDIRKWCEYDDLDPDIEEDIAEVLQDIDDREDNGHAYD